jgi:hypothetical protein
VFLACQLHLAVTWRVLKSVVIVIIGVVVVVVVVVATQLSSA